MRWLLDSVFVMHAVALAFPQNSDRWMENTRPLNSCYIKMYIFPRCYIKVYIFWRCYLVHICEGYYKKRVYLTHLMCNLHVRSEFTLDIAQKVIFDLDASWRCIHLCTDTRAHLTFIHALHDSWNVTSVLKALNYIRKWNNKGVHEVYETGGMLMVSAPANRELVCLSLV